MSRRNPSPADILIMLPWQVSATLGVVAFIGLRWVFPGMSFENPFYASVAKSSGELAWIPLLALGMLSAFSALLAQLKRALLDQQRDLNTLGTLSWQEFEWLVGEAYRRQGYSVEESLVAGADGGIDLILRKEGQLALVQCKRWKTQSVGAPVIREMFGLLTHHGATRVIVVTSGHFSRDALAFAEGKPIELLDGAALLTLVQTVQRRPSQKPTPTGSAPPVGGISVPVSHQAAALATDVLCPTCKAPMVKRTAKRGANAGNTFWGCSAYPTCRGVRQA